MKYPLVEKRVPTKCGGTILVRLFDTKHIKRVKANVE